LFAFRTFGFACCCRFFFIFPSFVSVPQIHLGNLPISSGNVFISSSSTDSFAVNSPIPDVLHSSHTLNSAPESDTVNVTAQERGNASSAMNIVLSGTTTQAIGVASQAPASMRFNPESVSNEIDESDVQYEKHCEQRI
jgi:hypothetical protein